MRIGELLLERSWVDQAGLERVLKEQPGARGRRLCSLLVSEGLLDFDHAARALAEQHGVPAALTRHLDQRDPELATLIPEELARQLLAVPIGRGRNGELVVGVRDPMDSVRDALAEACGLTVVVAVAPLELLAQVVERAYPAAPPPAPEPPPVPRPPPTPPMRPPPPPPPPSPDPPTVFYADRAYAEASTVRYALGDAPPAANEFDVDMSTGPVPALPDDDIPFANLALVELDDAGVTKDFSQSGAFPLPRTTTARAPLKRSETENELPIEIPKATLAETLEMLARAGARDQATEVAMDFVAHRWLASILFTIREGAAFGHRGHGETLSPDAIAAVVVPLTTPSIVKAAHDTRKLAAEVPVGAGAIQARLTNLLGLPDAPIAAPILVGAHVACVLAVGDPQGDPIGTDRADLDRLCAALGAAYARVIKNAKA